VPISPDRFLTPREVARRLAVRDSTVLRWIATGELPASNFGTAKRPRFKVAPQSLENFIAARAVIPSLPTPRGRRKQDDSVIAFF